MKTWEKVTVEGLIKIANLSTSDMDAIDKQVAVLSVASGIPEDTLWNYSKADIVKLSKKFDWLTDLPPEKKASRFEAGGYTWIPQLNISKLSLSQYVDLVEYLKDPINNIPAMLATVSEPVKYYPLFIKVKPKLGFDEKKELLKKTKATDAYGLSLFFCRVLIHLTNGMQGSLANQLKEMMKNQ